MSEESSEKKELHGMTVGELIKALADLPSEFFDSIVLYNHIETGRGRELILREFVVNYIKRDVTYCSDGSVKRNVILI